MGGGCGCGWSKWWPLAFNLLGGGKQICVKADILKIYTSKKPHGDFFITSPWQNDMKNWTSKMLVV